VSLSFLRTTACVRRFPRIQLLRNTRSCVSITLNFNLPCLRQLDIVTSSYAHHSLCSFHFQLPCVTLCLHAKIQSPGSLRMSKLFQSTTSNNIWNTPNAHQTQRLRICFPIIQLNTSIHLTFICCLKSLQVISLHCSRFAAIHQHTYKYCTFVLSTSTSLSFLLG
jgi:hypothetical protein